MSDRTWGRLGRRRPYFLAGAILSTSALFLMPNAGSLWMAAGLLWILDASINISMEPFRAFVADNLPEEQRTTGFTMQSLFIGAGAVIAGLLPWLLNHVFGIASETSTAHAIPLNVKIAFYVGAGAFLGAVLYTICTSREYPPEDLAAFRRSQAERSGLRHLLREIPDALRKMPTTMKYLALVQFFTWLGLFCMWLHFSNAVPVVFGASDTSSPLFKAGAEWAGVCYAAKDFVTFLAAFAIMALAARVDHRRVHALCLILGAAGLIAVGFIHGQEQKWFLFSALALGGIAWASILSMPYAMLAGALPPQRMGVYMGIFNFFIVLPEIIAALTFGPLVKNYLGGNLVYAVMAGGVFMGLAALLTLLVPRTHGPDTVSLTPEVFPEQTAIPSLPASE